jgi:hypothetical protein
MSFLTNTNRRLDLRNTHIGKEGLTSLLKTLDRGVPPSLPPYSSSSLPSLAYLRHLYLSLTNLKEEEAQLRVLKALLTKVGREGEKRKREGGKEEGKERATNSYITQ